VIDTTFVSFLNTTERILEFSINSESPTQANTTAIGQDYHLAGVSGSGSNATYFRTFLTFDTSSLGQATVESATLTVYMFRYALIYTPQAQLYSGADLYTSVTNAWNSINSAYREANFDISTLPGPNLGDCFGQWNNCRRQMSINRNSVSLTGRTQFIIPESGLVGWHPLKTLYPISSRYAYPPSLSVEIILDKPSLDVSTPTVQGQLTVTLDDNSDDEDLWVMQRSTSSSGPWSNICTNMRTGQSGACTGTDPLGNASNNTYNCSATNRPGTVALGTSGDCIFTDPELASSTRYYYRAYAYREQDLP